MTPEQVAEEHRHTAIAAERNLGVAKQLIHEALEAANPAVALITTELLCAADDDVAQRAARCLAELGAVRTVILEALEEL